MNLRLFDRIMLYVMMVLLIVVSAVSIVYCWNGAEPAMISNFFYILYASGINKILMTVFGAFLILFAVRIMFVRRHEEHFDDASIAHKRGVLVKNGNNEPIFVTYSAIDTTIKNIVMKNPEVVDCQCALVPAGEGISIAVKLALAYNKPVTDTSKEISTSLTKEVEKVIGIKVNAVKVTVDTPSNTALQTMPVEPQD